MASKYTVIKADTAINKDGEAVFGCDMSGLPEDFHALQWDGSDGHIEYSEVIKPNLSVTSESQIESALGISLSTLDERRTARIAEKKVASDAADVAKQADNKSKAERSKATKE